MKLYEYTSAHLHVGVSEQCREVSSAHEGMAHHMFNLNY